MIQAPGSQVPYITPSLGPFAAFFAGFPHAKSVGKLAEGHKWQLLTLYLTLLQDSLNDGNWKC